MKSGRDKDIFYINADTEEEMYADLREWIEYVAMTGGGDPLTEQMDQDLDS